MALINCPDCGRSISSTAPSCIHCGRPMASQDASTTAAPEPTQEPAPLPPAPSPEEFGASGWVLWRGDRQFGPMSGHELAGYFTSKMAVATDAVTGPGWSARVPATDAASILQLPAPLPAAAPDALKAASVAAPVSSYVYAVEPAGPSMIVILLWLVVLFALQFQLSLHSAAEPMNSARGVLGSSIGQFLLIALGCFGVIGLLGKALKGEFPSAVGPLFAMTLVYGVLFGNSLLKPEAKPITVAATPQAVSDTAPTPSFAPTQPVPRSDSQPIDFGDNVGHKDWFGFARALENKRDWKGVIDLTTEWIANEPDKADPWVFQGIAYYGLGQYAQSIEPYQQATRLAPDKAYIWNNMANSYLMLRNYPESEAAARTALGIDGHSAIAWNNLGAALQGEQKQDEAMADYQRAVAEDPNFAVAWANIGDQYYRRKQWPEALDAYQTALGADPSYQPAINGVANTQEMQKLAGQ